MHMNVEHKINSYSHRNQNFKNLCNEIDHTMNYQYVNYLNKNMKTKIITYDAKF
jgi:hypothetical protein